MCLECFSKNKSKINKFSKEGWQLTCARTASSNAKSISSSSFSLTLVMSSSGRTLIEEMEMLVLLLLNLSV